MKKSRKIPDAWRDVNEYKRTPKTKKYKQFPFENWMDKEKRDLSKVKRKK